MIIAIVRQREIGHFLRRQIGVHIGLVGLQGCCERRDRDFLVLGADFELHIDARHSVDAGEDAGLGKQAEPRRGDLDVVFAGHDIAHGVAAGLVR